jgi:hypothetical protein
MPRAAGPSAGRRLCAPQYIHHMRARQRADARLWMRKRSGTAPMRSVVSATRWRISATLTGSLSVAPSCCDTAPRGQPSPGWRPVRVFRTFGRNPDLRAGRDARVDDDAGLLLVVVPLRGVDVPDAGGERELAHLGRVLARLAAAVPPAEPRDLPRALSAEISGRAARARTSAPSRSLIVSMGACAAMVCAER